MSDHDAQNPPRERRLIDAAREQAAGARTAGGSATAAGSSSQEASTKSPPPDSTPPADSIPGYRILREIHRGGQGVVYQALQESTRRKVAIKVLREGPFAGPADKLRFDREVQILGQLRHPNIVTVHDSGSAAGQVYLVMDYIAGQPLDVYMASSERSIEDTLRLFARICEAVNAAHLRGVIHRDLKPANIRVDERGEPYVLDFGLAKVALGSDGQAMTMTGQFVGSLPWSAPEQAEGQPGQIDVRTDVYALGVILYQMLTRQFPYDVVGPIREVMDRILTAEPARPSTLRKQIDDEVETIVLKALSKERARRYQSAGELARDVERYLAGEPIEAKRDSGWYVLRKSLRRYRAAVAVASCFVSLLVVSLIVALVLWRQADVSLRAAETARAQLQTVAEFQAATLADVDAEAMGLAIVDAFQDRVRAVLDEDTRSPSDTDERLQTWRAQMLQAGPTTVALDVLSDFVLTKSLHTIDTRFGDQPLVRARLLQTVATTLRELGLLARAAHPQAEALRIRRVQLGDEHPDTLTSIQETGYLLCSEGRYEAATPFYGEALDGFRRVCGEDALETLKSVARFGGLLLHQEKLDEAERYFRQAVEGFRRTLGDDHPETLFAIASLGFYFEWVGDLTKAEQHLGEALAGCRRILGDQHVDTLAAMDLMAGVLRSQGRHAEAEHLAREALNGCRRVLGDEHPNTLVVLRKLRVVLEEQGKFAEAAEVQEEIRALEQRFRGHARADSLDRLPWAND